MGVRRRTFTVMGTWRPRVDARFRWATPTGGQLLRTAALGSASRSHGNGPPGHRARVACRLLPATDDLLRTRLRLASGEWLAFQDYFVLRGHRTRWPRWTSRSAAARPGPGSSRPWPSPSGVIAPSNRRSPIWPILRCPDREAVGRLPVWR